MLNNITIQGRLTKDVECSALATGTTKGVFTLAVERSMKSKDGTRQSDFIPCVAFGKTAEIINQYSHKGDMILVTGSVQTYTYEKDGQKRSGFSVVVSEFNFCGSKSQASAPVANPVAPDINTASIPVSTNEEVQLPFDF